MENLKLDIIMRLIREIPEKSIGRKRAVEIVLKEFEKFKKAKNDNIN